MLQLPPPPPPAVVVQHDVPVAMRDGVRLMTDVYRPDGAGRVPVLVYRTPYGKHEVPRDYTTITRALVRGYAVVVQDVRGRYGSEGTFDAYRQEGRDGYDTIEWAAAQPWSTGAVGAFGLSYPAAVQWLAAMESPPHLRAIVPAMSFASPRRFFYAGGAWDLSWASWTAINIMPDLRRRAGAPGPRTEREAREAWARDDTRVLSQLPLLGLTDFAPLAPWYTEWMRREPTDPWWDWAELRGRYGRTSAAVLNWSGWHDEAYGPSGAIANFRGLVASRGAPADARAARTGLIVGPWVHGVDATGEARAGDRAFAPNAAVDYDAIVLDWMDRHVKGDTTVETGAPVRVYVMGANAWRTAERWPLPGIRAESLFLQRGGGLSATAAARRGGSPTSFVSDPAAPLRDPYDAAYGAHDLRALSARRDVAVFETAPLVSDIEVVGAMRAELYVSTDAKDVDLYVKVLDVAPDGTAYPLMSPGLEVQRASYREPRGPRRLVTPGAVFRMTWNELLTANRFRRGHRLRVLITAAYEPHFSLNLQTGASERDSARTVPATIRIWHDATRRSRLVLPVLPAGASAEADRVTDVSADVAAILDARRRSNEAIAAHDTAGIRREWAPEVHVVSSTGASVAGADANLAELQRRFEARPDIRWVRRPTAVEVFDRWDVASEHGEWVGTWTDPDGPVEVSGPYLAQWRRAQGTWRIGAEVFVPRRCRGGRTTCK